jgi:CheY-like chemotaxis protein
MIHFDTDHFGCNLIQLFALSVRLLVRIIKNGLPMQTVLLVEDNPRVCAVYLTALQEIDANVLVASSVSEAIGIIQACREVSVVITDFRLPDGDGLFLVQSIRETCMQQEWLQFILVTGHASVSVAQRAIELGVRKLLTKPVRREEIVKAATDALLDADTFEAKKKTGELVFNTLAEFESRLGTISRIARLRDEANEKAKDYQKHLRVLIQLELDRRSRLNRSQLSDNEWILLLQVEQAELDGNPITLKSVAYGSGIPLSSLIRQANFLSERGLLKRANDPCDARRSLLRITPRARAIIQKNISYNPELIVSEDSCTD